MAMAVLGVENVGMIMKARGTCIPGSARYPSTIASDFRDENNYY